MVGVAMESQISTKSQIYPEKKKSMNPLSFAVLFLFGFIFCWAAFWKGEPSKASSSQQTLSQVKRDSQRMAPGTLQTRQRGGSPIGMNATRTVNLPVKNGKSPVSQVSVSRVEDPVGKLLLQTLHDDLMSERFLKCIVSNQNYSKDHSSKLEYSNCIEQAAADPETSIFLISRVVDALPATQFKAERETLLELALNLPGAESKALAMVRNEILYKPEVAISAHEQLIWSLQDNEVIRDYTIAGVVAHKDDEIRGALVRQYLERFPENESDLRRRLERAGIPPIPTQDDV